LSQRTEQRPRRRFEKKEEIWIPKTSLGKKVASGEITTIEEIFFLVLEVQEWF